MKPECVRCGRDDRAIFRTTPLGEPGRFMCEECLPQANAPDPEVLRIAHLIEADNASPKEGK